MLDFLVEILLFFQAIHVDVNLKEKFWKTDEKKPDGQEDKFPIKDNT